MIRRSNLQAHISDFNALSTVDQSAHLRQDHGHAFVDVFSGERRFAHQKAHSEHPPPDQSHPS